MRRADDLRAHFYRQLKQSGDFISRISSRDGIYVVVEDFFVLFRIGGGIGILREVRFVAIVLRLAGGLEDGVRVVVGVVFRSLRGIIFFPGGCNLDLASSIDVFTRRRRRHCLCLSLCVRVCVCVCVYVSLFLSPRERVRSRERERIFEGKRSFGLTF